MSHIWQLWTVRIGHDPTLRGAGADFRDGSWLCKNAKTLNRDRKNYSSKTAFVAQLASDFNLEVELKNIILIAILFFEFLHSQGHFRKLDRLNGMSDLPPKADIRRQGRHVRFVQEGDICIAANCLTSSAAGEQCGACSSGLPVRGVVRIHAVNL